MKNITIKIFASIALFGIIIGIIGTGVLFFATGNQEQSNNTKELTQEQLKAILASASGASLSGANLSGALTK